MELTLFIYKTINNEIRIARSMLQACTLVYRLLPITRFTQLEYRYIQQHRLKL